MLDTNYIRTQILLVADAGPLVSQVIQNVINEAHRYGRACAGRPAVGVDPAEIREDLTGLLALARREKAAEASP